MNIERQIRNSELPKHVKAKAVKAFKRIRQNNEADFLDEAVDLGSAFIWAETSENMSFWSRVHDVVRDSNNLRRTRVKYLIELIKDSKEPVKIVKLASKKSGIFTDKAGWFSRTYLLNRNEVSSLNKLTTKSDLLIELFKML